MRAVPFANKPDPPMQDWNMALEIVKIAIIQLVNTIEPPFTIRSSPNLDSIIIERVYTIEAPFTI